MRYVAPDMITGEFPPLDVPPPKPDRKEARPFQFLDCDPDIRGLHLMGNWPDCTISASYDYVDQLDYRALGWEFLRRNPFFIADYHAWKDLHSRAIAGPNCETPCSWDGVAKASAAITNRYGLNAGHYPPSPSIFSPPLLAGQSGPKTSNVLMLRETTDGPPTWKYALPEKGIGAAIWIDGSRSLKEDIDTLIYYREQILAIKEQTKNKLKLNINKPCMKIYLQILDAKAAWHSNEQIIGNLECIRDGKTVNRGSAHRAITLLSRDYKTAREFALHGYRTLFDASIHTFANSQK